MPPPVPPDPDLVCVTDIGSTTTKAVLFLREHDAWRFLRAEAPTTVERPHEDVMVGVIQALRVLEHESGRRLLDGHRPAVPYFTTSSAGGGLAMVVTGLVSHVTSASAERVALGAGAIVLDVLAMDDGRTPYEKILALQQTRPDMVLLAGGFDGEALSGPVFLAELIREAHLHPKQGTGALPVIYAGNQLATDLVRQTLGEGYLIHPVPNIRPASDRENLEPAREAIHSLFMHHVMAHAPGYGTLLDIVSGPILPTPAAFATILEHASASQGRKMLAVDIGGATTDVFSIEAGSAFRTVSANLGMSYSALNVVRSVGVDRLTPLAPAQTPEALLDRVGNKHIDPTGLPATKEEMESEWAVATVAIREAVRAHLAVRAGFSLSRDRSAFSFRSPLNGTKRKTRAESEELDLSGYEVLVGSGGILSHSRPDVAAMLMVNALRPRHRVELAVDRAFMFPHLGVLSGIYPALAGRLFNELALVSLGQAVWRGRSAGGRAVHATGSTSTGRRIDVEAPFGSVRLVAIMPEEEATLTVDGTASEPPVEVSLHRPALGCVIDTRDRHARPEGSGAATVPWPFVLLPGDPPLPPPRARTANVGAVRRGFLVERRELAIPGDVLVTQGEPVTPDTIIARSQRVFRRPFFLDIARSLGIPPSSVEECLLKRIGDSVAEQEEVARVRRGPLRFKRYLSQVAGTVERLLPSGTLVLREPPQKAEQLGTAMVADDLGVRPDQIMPYVKVEVGQRVEKGQWLASVIRPDAFRYSAAPVGGTVREINTRWGLIHIQPLREELEVQSWVSGTVGEVTDKGCTVTTWGLEITGVWGAGAEAWGRLTMGSPAHDAIIVRSTATGDDLRAATEARVRGLLAGSVHLRDVWDVSPPFPLVVTGGFGAAPMEPALWEILSAQEGSVASMNATTSLRVGVQRPRLLIPLHERS